MEIIHPIKGIKSLEYQAISDQPIYISQLFGMNLNNYTQFGMKGHNGIDIAAPKGTPIFAVHDGKITYGFEANGYGNYAKLRFDFDGFTWEFINGAHMNKKEGSDRIVKQGDIIGYVGTTGFSTGNHLHFGYKKLLNGKVLNYDNGYFGSLDPMPLLKTMNQTKPYLAKDGKTILLVTPMAMDMENFRKQAGIEGIEIPNPIPPASEL